jgi:prevent-host-death family protein
METVGSYDAKTHWPALLDRVAKGEEITITRHGVPVAVLVPPSRAGKRDVSAVIQDMIEARKGVRLGGLSIRELIEEGRR